MSITKCCFVTFTMYYLFVRDMDPQFVVTLNGYDPDGLYSQSELDIDLEGENDDWLRESGGQDPLLTSTPDQTVSPSLQRSTSPNVIVNGPAINHSSTSALFI